MQYFRILSALVWCLFVAICWIITTQMKIRLKTRQKAVKMYTLFVLMFGLTICNVVHVTYSYAAKEGLSVFNQLLSWVILCKLLLKLCIIPELFVHWLVFFGFSYCSYFSNFYSKAITDETAEHLFFTRCSYVVVFDQPRCIIFTVFFVSFNFMVVNGKLYDWC